MPAVAIIFPTPLLPENRILDEIVKPVEKAFLKTGELDSIEVQLIMRGSSDTYEQIEEDIEYSTLQITEYEADFDFTDDDLL